MGFDERALADMASSRFGLFTRSEAVDLGATASQIRSRHATGRWERAHLGVYSFPGHADSWRRRLWGALLSAGPSAVVGFQSAAQLHAFQPVEHDLITLIVGRVLRHATADATWHRLDDLLPSHLEAVDGFPVTTRARTIIDLAAVCRRGRFELMVEDAITRNLVTVADVGTVLGQIRRRGKPGVRLAEHTLDLLGPGEALGRSELEKLLAAALRLARLPEPSFEHPLPSVQAMTGFVDCCFPEAKWIIEADGRRWHERRTQMAKDSERDTEAARCGYLTTRRHWEHLAKDPEGCAAAFVDIYDQRVRLLSVKGH